MKSQRIIDSFPSLYHSFFPAFFDKSIPTEVFSNCNSCSMVCSSKEKIPTLAMKPFNEKTKCCTYFPRIPNYLVGAILNDDNSTLLNGQIRIKNIIEKKISVIPRGIFGPKIYEQVYPEAKKNGFGQSEALLCPYYEKEAGSCSIWKYRNSACSTYFCKYTASNKGKEFWLIAEQYLRYVEDCLTDYTLLELNFYDTIVHGITSEITSEDIEGKPPINYEKIWNGLNIKEENFYIESYNIVQKLTTEKFNQILGIKGEVLLKKLEHSYDKMISMPEVLIKNPYKIFDTINDNNYTIILDRIDVNLELPKDIIDVFDGKRQNNENVELLAKINIEIDNDLLLTLYNYHILVAPNMI